MSTALGYLQGSSVLYELEDPETQLGRAETNDIVLKNSRSISSVHARIVIHPRKRQTATLVDLNSMNGSFVNENRVHNDGCPLSSGDVLRFGYDQESYRFFFPEDLPRTLLDPDAAASATSASGAAARGNESQNASAVMGSPQAAGFAAGRRSGLFSPSSADGTRHRDLAGSGVAAALHSPDDSGLADAGDADSLNRSGASVSRRGRSRSGNNRLAAITSDMTPAGIPSRRSPTVGRSLSPYDTNAGGNHNDEGDDIGRSRSPYTKSGRRPLSASAAPVGYSRSPLGGGRDAKMTASGPAASTMADSRSPRSLGAASGGPPWRDRAARRGRGENSVWGNVGGPGNNEDIPVTIAYPTAGGTKVESPTADRLKKLQEQKAAEEAAAMLGADDDEDAGPPATGALGESNHLGARYDYGNEAGMGGTNYNNSNNYQQGQGGGDDSLLGDGASNNNINGATGQSFFPSSRPQSRPPITAVQHDDEEEEAEQSPRDVDIESRSHDRGSSASSSSSSAKLGGTGKRAVFQGDNDDYNDNASGAQPQLDGNSGSSNSLRASSASLSKKAGRAKSMRAPAPIDDSEDRLDDARAAAAEQGRESNAEDDGDDDDRGSKRSGGSGNGVAWTVEPPAGTSSNGRGRGPPPLRSRENSNSSSRGQGNRQARSSVGSKGGDDRRQSYGGAASFEHDRVDDADDNGSHDRPPAAERRGRSSQVRQQDQRRNSRNEEDGSSGSSSSSSARYASPVSTKSRRQSANGNNSASSASEGLASPPVINITANGPVTLQTDANGRLRINGSDPFEGSSSSNNNNLQDVRRSQGHAPPPPMRASASGSSGSNSSNAEADALRAELASLRASMVNNSSNHAATQPSSNGARLKDEAASVQRPGSAASASSSSSSRPQSAASPSAGLKSPRSASSGPASPKKGGKAAAPSAQDSSAPPSPRKNAGAASDSRPQSPASPRQRSRSASASASSARDANSEGGFGQADQQMSQRLPGEESQLDQQQQQQQQQPWEQLDGDTAVTGQEAGEPGGVLSSTISSRLKDIRVPDTSDDGMGMGIGPGRAALSALSMRQPGEKGVPLSGQDMRNSLRWAATLRSPAGPNGVPLPPTSPAGFTSPGRSGRSARSQSASRRPASAGAVENLLGSAGKGSRRSSSATVKGSARKSSGGLSKVEDERSVTSGRPLSAPPQLQGLGTSAFLTSNDQQPGSLTLTARAPFDGPLSAGGNGADAPAQLTSVFTPAGSNPANGQQQQQPVGTYPPGQSANAAAPPLMGGTSGGNGNNNATSRRQSFSSASQAGASGAVIAVPTAVPAVPAPQIPQGAGTITSAYLPSLEAGLEPQVRSKLPPGQARELALSALLRTREEQLRRMLGGADNEIISLAGFAATGMPAVKDGAIASGDANAAGLAAMAASSNTQYQQHLQAQQQQHGLYGAPVPPPAVPGSAFHGYAFTGGNNPNNNTNNRDNSDNASVVSGAGGLSTIGGMGFGRAFGGPSNLTAAARRGSFSTVAAASGFGGAPASVAGPGAGRGHRPWSAGNGPAAASGRAFGSPKGTNNTAAPGNRPRSRSPTNGWGSHGNGYGGFGGGAVSSRLFDADADRGKRPGSPGGDAPHTPTGGELVTIPIDIDPTGRGFYPPQRAGSRNGRNSANSPGSASAFGLYSQQAGGPPLTAAQERANLLFQAVNEEAPEDPVLGRMVAPGLPLPIPSPQANKGPLHYAAATATAAAQQQAAQQLQQQAQQQAQQQLQPSYVMSGRSGSAFQSPAVAPPPLMLESHQHQQQAPQMQGPLAPLGTNNSLSSRLVNAKQYRMSALTGGAPPSSEGFAAQPQMPQSSSLPALGGMAASTANGMRGGGSVMGVPLAYQQQQQQQQRQQGQGYGGSGAGAVGQGHLASTILSGGGHTATYHNHGPHNPQMPAVSGARPLVAELASRPALAPAQRAAAYGCGMAGGSGLYSSGMGVGQQPYPAGFGGMGMAMAGTSGAVGPRYPMMMAAAAHPASAYYRY